MAVTHPYILTEKIVAEAVAQSIVHQEHRIIDVRNPVCSRRQQRMIIDKPVVIVPTILSAVGECQIVALLWISDRLRPCHTTLGIVAPCMVGRILVVDVYRIIEVEKTVERI